MKKLFGFILLVMALATVSCVETHILTSRSRTNELLSIHASIGPKVPFDMNTSKIIMFSDLHRGMGSKDVFKQNIELFEQILKYYYENGFTLVLIGDVEEGWGFQRDNIPLILDEHGNEFALEKKFQAENRYYRVYGNHDDFFRGQWLNVGGSSLQRIFPALVFTDEQNKFNIFITHGCQGQGLHDAGDQLASWGVYAKYNWWLEIFPEKLKSEKDLHKKMKAIQDDLEKHEQMLYDWTLNQEDAAGNKKYQILVAGHTHIPVFNSIPDPHLYDVMLKDIESGRYIFFNDIFEGEEANKSLKLTESLKAKLKEKLILKRDMAIKAQQLNAEAPKDPFYFNTGCGFHSEITCIEISGGKIYLKSLFFDQDKKIDFVSFIDSGDLENYQNKPN